MWEKSWVRAKQLQASVAKVGGSLLRSPEDFTKILGLVVERLGAGGGLVLVVSAVKGVTDMIIRMCNGDRGSLERVLQTHRMFSESLGLEGEAAAHAEALERELEELSRVCGESAAARDRALSIGERFSATGAAQVLRSMGLRPVIAWPWDLGLVTDDLFGDASPLIPEALENLRARIPRLLAEGSPVIVPGFFGVTRSGEVATMGRGSSDLTAVLIARALGVESLYLVTETPGIMSADPRIVPSARRVREMDLAEGEAASRYRVKGLGVKTFRHLRGYRGVLWILGPGMEGTRICEGCGSPGVKVVASFDGGAAVIGRGSGEALVKILRRAGDGILVRAVSDVEALVTSEREDPVELVRIVHREVIDG